MSNNNAFEIGAAYLYKNQPYWGNLLIQFRRVVDRTIGTAGVAIKNGGVTLYYNPEFIDAMYRAGGPGAVAFVLQHEAQHIAHRHLAQGRSDGKYARMSNIAMDCSINQLNMFEKEMTPQANKKMIAWFEEQEAKALAEGKKTPKDNGNKRGGDKKVKGSDKCFIDLSVVREMTGRPDLKEEEVWEYYYQYILEKAKENSKNGIGEPDYMIGDHEVWDRSEGSEEAKDQICRNAIEKAANNTGRGNLPSDVQAILKALEKDRVKWAALFRNFISNQIDIYVQSDIRKRNRRYGIKVPGRRKETKLDVVVCNDTSGSVSDEALGAVHAELIKMHKAGVRIRVVDADAEVAQVFEFDPKKPYTARGRGGTYFSPALKEAEKMKPDLIIYFTDGYGEGAENVYRPKGIPVLWGVYTQDGMSGCPPEHKKILIDV